MIHVNKYSRPGKQRLSTDRIVVHYSGGPGQLAEEVKTWLAGEHRFGGYTLIVDDHQTLQLAPWDEMTPHVGGSMTALYKRLFGNPRYFSGYSIQNWHTLGICFCHPDKTGKPTEKTYQKLVNIVAMACIRYNLGVNAIDRHYDATKKDCPLYFVDNPIAWDTFKSDVKQILSMF